MLSRAVPWLRIVTVLAVIALAGAGVSGASATRESPLQLPFRQQQTISGTVVGMDTMAD